jgi:putative transposase
LGDAAPDRRCGASPIGDFVHDQRATGRKIRILMVVDTVTRFSPVIDPRISYRGEDVVQTLERIRRGVGYSRAIRVDQGSEFVSRDLDLWADQKNVVLDVSRPLLPDSGLRANRDGGASRRTTGSPKASTASSAPRAGTPTGS